MPSLKKKLLNKRISRTSFQKKSQIRRSKRGQKSKKNIFKRSKKKIVGGADEIKQDTFQLKITKGSFHFYDKKERRQRSEDLFHFLNTKGDRFDLITSSRQLERKRWGWVVESVNEDTEDNIKVVISKYTRKEQYNQIHEFDCIETKSFSVTRDNNLQELKKLAQFDDMTLIKRTSFVKNKYGKMVPIKKIVAINLEHNISGNRDKIQLELSLDGYYVSTKYNEDNSVVQIKITKIDDNPKSPQIYTLKLHPHLTTWFNNKLERLNRLQRTFPINPNPSTTCVYPEFRYTDDVKEKEDEGYTYKKVICKEYT